MLVICPEIESGFPAIASTGLLTPSVSTRRDTAEVRAELFCENAGAELVTVQFTLPAKSHTTTPK